MPFIVDTPQSNLSYFAQVMTETLKQQKLLEEEKRRRLIDEQLRERQFKLQEKEFASEELKNKQAQKYNLYKTTIDLLKNASEADRKIVMESEEFKALAKEIGAPLYIPRETLSLSEELAKKKFEEEQKRYAEEKVTKEAKTKAEKEQQELENLIDLSKLAISKDTAERLKKQAEEATKEKKRLEAKKDITEKNKIIAEYNELNTWIMNEYKASNIAKLSDFIAKVYADKSIDAKTKLKIARWQNLLDKMVALEKIPPEKIPESMQGSVPAKTKIPNKVSPKDKVINKTQQAIDTAKGNDYGEWEIKYVNGQPVEVRLNKKTGKYEGR